MALDVLLNPWRTSGGGAAGGREAPALVYHRGLDGYGATELREAPELAEAMGVERVWLKIESERFGLPAFKILGASWAAERLLAEARGGSHEQITLVTASDGNHGRAVARVARMRDLACRVLMPQGTAEARIAAIDGEGAQVEVIDGDYDRAVAMAAELAIDAHHLLIQDTAWPGYERAPRWVAEGYETIFAEVTGQISGAVPDLALIPIGVGSLAIAAARQWPGRTPRLVGFEPHTAACAYRSIDAGRSIAAPGPHESMMAGLNCGTLSLHAWPLLRSRYDAFCAIGDDLAADGMRLLARMGIEAGEVSGGAVGCALAACGNADARRRLGITTGSGILLVLTEGVTDPQNWRQTVAAS